MKKLVTTVSTAISASTMFIASAFAGLNEDNTDINGLSTANGTTAGVKGAIVNFITRVLDFILIIAIVYVIVAGIRLIVSGGDEGEKDKSKTTIVYVLIGIIVVLFARVIVLFVNNLIQ